MAGAGAAAWMSEPREEKSSESLLAYKDCCLCAYGLCTLTQPHAHMCVFLSLCVCVRIWMCRVLIYVSLVCVSARLWSLECTRAAEVVINFLLAQSKNITE